MARRPTPLHYSPDPLALSDEHVADECIKVCSPTNGPPGSVSGIPQKPATPRRGTVKPIVEIPSPSKSKRHHSEAQNEVARVRTPLARASPSANRSSPTPNTKGRTKGKALVTPMKNAKKLVGHGSSISRSKEPTLASSLSKPLPTPSPTQIGKRVRLSSSKVEDAFTDPSPSSISTISRETFLANESLRRQREARKFIYTGDANAPKLTRSGRTVGEAAIEPDDGDEYGEDEEGDCDMGVDEDGVQEVMLPVAPTISLPTPMPMLDVSIDTTAKKILPFSARPHVLHILSTLTSQNIATNSPAFASEDANEALQGLVNLLKGTVERGEGNSALVVGARGAGKTRVSDSRQSNPKLIRVLDNSESAESSSVNLHFKSSRCSAFWSGSDQ